MVLHKLPKGARATGEWTEVSSEGYPVGYCDEVTVVTYERPVTYDGRYAGFGTRVEVYRHGYCHFAQNYYGETAHSDAQREAGDQVTKLIYAKVASPNRV